MSLNVFRRNIYKNIHFPSALGLGTTKRYEIHWWYSRTPFGQYHACYDQVSWRGPAIAAIDVVAATSCPHIVYMTKRLRLRQKRYSFVENWNESEYFC